MADEEFRIRITGDAADLQQASQAGATSLRNLEEAAKPAAEATGEIGMKGRDLKKVLAELGREFPILGTLGRVALNPIALAVAAATALFARLKQDIAELEEALATTEFERYGEAATKALRGGADGAGAMRRELEGIRLAAEQAAGASERLLTVYQARQSAEERLDAARKKVELARAGRIEDPLKRAEAEAEIEGRYAARARQRAEERTRFELAEQHRRLANEQIAERMLSQRLEAAQARNEEAARIEARLVEERKRLAAINEDIVAKQEKLEKLEPFDKTSPGGTIRRVEIDSLRQQLEQLGALRTQQERYIGLLEVRKPAAVSPEYISLLEQMRSGAAARASGIAGMLPTQMAVAGIESAARRQVGGLEDLARVHAVSAQITQQRAQLAERIISTLESGRGLDQALMDRLAAIHQREAAMLQRINTLESQVAGLRMR